MLAISHQHSALWSVRVWRAVRGRLGLARRPGSEARRRAVAGRRPALPLLLLVAISASVAAQPAKKSPARAVSAAAEVRSTDRALAEPNAQLVKTRIARTTEWYRNNLRGAYEATGTRNAKCDPAAIEALSAAADLWSRNSQRAGNEAERIWRSSHQAVAAGCDDPLVLLIHARGYELVALESWDDAIRMYREAASALDASKYSAAIKSLAHLRTAEAMIAGAMAKKSESARGIPEHVEAARDLLPAIAANRDVPATLVLDLVEGILDVDRKLGSDRQEGFDAIIPLFTEARPANDVLLPLLRARFLIDYAWDARGGQWAEGVTENAMSVFLSRIDDAERSVAMALAVDPLSPAIAPMMLTIELAQGRGRERMESWFRYGVAVDPGNDQLYFAKLHYLDPRWHGSPEEMVAFGRESLATKQWALRIPFILAAAHFTLSGAFENAGDYYRENPQACRDSKAVFDPYLQLFPESAYDRSGYALLLYDCGEFEAANRQFQTLGSDGRRGPFRTRANYEHKRMDSAARATAKRQ